MHPRLEGWIRSIRTEAVEVLRKRPVELMLVVASAVSYLVIYELEGGEKWLWRAGFMQCFALLALAVSNFAGRGPWRKLYWVCWLPLVPLLCWSGLQGWAETATGRLALFVLTPLLLLLSRRPVRNEQFVHDAAVWISSGALAMFFANVTLGLFCAILYSTTYIFGLEGVWIEHTAIWAVILCEVFLAPVLFLMMTDRWLGQLRAGSRLMDVLINYIVTPALLIYTAILSLYMIRILVAWELPRGGVAYLVFGFTLAALAVQAMQWLLQRRVYDWFFNWFSFIALPTQVLFWIGALRRVNEYGLTQPRVYLLVCGGLMTLCVVLFLWRRTGRYFWVAVAAFVCIWAMVFIPGLDAETLAKRSQARRVELGLNTEDSSTSKGKYYRFSLPDNFRLTVDAAYPHLVTNLSSWGDELGYTYQNDTLQLHLGEAKPVWQISGAELLNRQIARAGFTAQTIDSVRLSASMRGALLDYRDEHYRILFEGMNIERHDTTLLLTGVDVGLVLTR